MINDCEQAFEMLSLDNFIKPMNDVEFLEFLSKDRYGNTNPEKDSILNLLQMILNQPGYEHKEKLIYQYLHSITKINKQ